MDSKIIKTPNQLLAEEIVNALREAGLINEDSVKSLGKKLADGQIKESDWKLELEAALKKDDGK